MEISSKVAKYALFYVLIFIFSVISFYVLRVLNNIYLVSAIISLFALVILMLVLKGREDALFLREKGMIRYAMLCKSCGWEWMSNVTDKKAPSKCPSCNEKKRLEIIGWRVVQPYQEQKNEELTKFFKK
jgi:hypothetical protein